MEPGALLYVGSVIAFETYLLLKFIDKSLDRRDKISIIFLASILISLQIVQRIFFGTMGAISIIPTFLLDLLCIGIGFHGKYSKKIFLLCIFYAFSIILDSIASLIVSFCYLLIYCTNGDVNLLAVPSTVLSKSLLLSVIFLLKDSLKMRNNLNDWLKYLPAPLLTVIAIMWGSPFSKDIRNSDIAGLLVVICAFSLLCNIYLIISIHRKYEQVQLKYRIKILDEGKQMGKIHYMELLEAYRQIERTAHDIKHHLNYLEAAEDLVTMSEYIKKLNKKGFSKVEKLTGNFDIDVILSAKKHETDEKGIELKVNQILLPEMEWLDAVDIVSILGNCISNAIEACEQCNNSKISVIIRYSDDCLLIAVENPTNHKPVGKVKGAGIMSTKLGDHHGLGMESIAASVDVYDGLMKYEVKNNIFRIDILLQSSIRK